MKTFVLLVTLAVTTAGCNRISSTIRGGVRGAFPDVAASFDRKQELDMRANARRQELARRQGAEPADIEHYELMDRLDAINDSQEGARFDEQQRWYSDRR